MFLRDLCGIPVFLMCFCLCVTTQAVPPYMVFVHGQHVGFYQSLNTNKVLASTLLGQGGCPSTYHDVFRLEVLMDNVLRVEVTQPFTHANNDNSSISRGQL